MYDTFSVVEGPSVRLVIVSSISAQVGYQSWALELNKNAFPSWTTRFNAVGCMCVLVGAF